MLWYVLAIALFALGSLIVLVACYWDRPGWRGRPKERCRKCWYNLQDSGQFPITCPECGRVSKSPRSVTRTRRHKRFILLGLLLIMASMITAFTPAYQNGTLLSRVPSWMLVELVPVSPEWRKKIGVIPNQNHPGMELLRRMSGNGRQMSHEQLVDVINRAAEGNIFASPGSKKWARTTGDWIGSQQFRFKDRSTGMWQYPDGTPADQPLIDAYKRLVNVLPEWNPKTRSLWPEGQVVTIWSGFEHPRWSTGELYESASLVIRGHQEQPEHIEVKNFLSYFPIRSRGKAGDELVCDITLNYHRPPEDWDWKSDLPSIHSEQFTIRWTVVSEMKDAIELVDSQAIRNVMILNTATSVTHALDGFDFQSNLLDPQFNGIGFGVIIQVFDGEEFLGQSEQHWMNDNGEWVGRIQSMMGTTMEQVMDYPTRAADAIQRGTLRYRIIGDPGLALELIEPKRVWNGQIDILYTDALKAIESGELDQ